MKITTWNVNGLRSVMAKGNLAWLAEQSPDVLCLQEIKTRPEQLVGPLPDYFASYQVYWHPAERPGYSGVATLVREEVSAQIGVSLARFDIEGRAIVTRHPGFLLFNIYFPNGQRDQGRLNYKLDFYAHLLEQCDRLHAAGEQVVICGDFNTAHRPIDLRNPRQNEMNSGFLPQERAWIDQYLSHGFVDAYRALYPERVQYTWWTYRLNARLRNIGWRLDYFLVSQGLMDRVQDVVVHEEITGSDHCPVSLIIQ